MDKAELVAMAFARAKSWEGLNRPERYGPLQLPEGLPAPIPAWWTEQAVQEEEVSG